MTAGTARRVAWVTGASRGMGANTAVELARAGFDVALTARDRTRLEAVAEQVRAAGGDALPFAADLTDRASVAAFADAAVDRFGRCDVLCNIGVYQGPAMRTVLLDTSLDELAASLEADVVAPALLCRRALPLMLENGGGTVVNMSSNVAVLEPRASVESQRVELRLRRRQGRHRPPGRHRERRTGRPGHPRLHRRARHRRLRREAGRVPDEVRRRARCRHRSRSGRVSSGSSTPPTPTRCWPKRIDLPRLTHQHGLLPGWGGPGSPVPPPDAGRSDERRVRAALTARLAIA